MSRAPARRKHFAGSISIRALELLDNLSKNIGSKKSLLFDEAIYTLANEYIEKGGIQVTEENTEHKPRNLKHIICITNYKGGAGKTTTAVELAYLFSKDGKKVLLIDTDGQCNATQRLQPVNLTAKNTIEYCLVATLKTAKFPIEVFLRPTEYNNLDILAGSVMMGDDEFQSKLTAFRARSGINPYDRIINLLRKSGRYDVIIFDTHPGIDNTVLFPIQASTDVLIPLDATRDGVSGAQAVYRAVVESREVKPINFLGMFFNRVALRTEKNLTAIPAYRRELPEAIKRINDGVEDGRIFDTVIRQSGDVDKCIERKCALNDQFHGKAIAKDFVKLYREVVDALE